MVQSAPSTDVHQDESWSKSFNPGRDGRSRIIAGVCVESLLRRVSDAEEEPGNLSFSEFRLTKVLGPRHGRDLQPSVHISSLPLYIFLA
jgi:hypothetical protein